MIKLKVYKNGGTTIGLGPTGDLYIKLYGTNGDYRWVTVNSEIFSISYGISKRPSVVFNKRSLIDIVIERNENEFYIKNVKYDIVGNGEITYDDNFGVWLDCKKHPIRFNVIFENMNVTLNTTHLEGLCQLVFGYDETTNTIHEITSTSETPFVLIGERGNFSIRLAVGGGEPK